MLPGVISTVLIRLTVAKTERNFSILQPFTKDNWNSGYSSFSNVPQSTSSGPTMQPDVALESKFFDEEQLNKKVAGSNPGVSKVFNSWNLHMISTILLNRGKTELPQLCILQEQKTKK